MRPCGVDVFLETDRLLLRRFTPADVEAVIALDSDPAVRRFVEDGEPVDRDTAARTIRHWMDWYQRSEEFGFWAAVDKEHGTFLGWFHLRPGQGTSDCEPELGYRLVSTAWGRGYATEGSRALIDRAFSSPRVDRVVAETLAVHGASRRVMEKAGMRHVRTFPTQWPVRIPGDEAGDVEYVITRADWEAAHR